MAINVDITPSNVALAVLITILAYLLYSIGNWIRAKADYETVKLQMKIQQEKKREGEPLNDVSKPDTLGEVIQRKLKKLEGKGK